MTTSHLILLLLLSIIVKIHCDDHDDHVHRQVEDKELCSKSHNNLEEGICWQLQDETTRPHIKPGDDCVISRITESVGAVVDSNNTSNDTNTTTAVQAEPEVFVIDPCMNEENRNFMECVLDHDPNLKDGDPGYNKGKCQCYRNWFVNEKGPLQPAYNHTMNLEKDSDDWFIYNQDFQECVVKDREPCALTVDMAVPYRCEGQGICFQVGPDPHYKVCTSETIKMEKKNKKEEHKNETTFGQPGQVIIFLSLIVLFIDKNFN